MTDQQLLKPTVPSTVGHKRSRLEYDLDTSSELAGSHYEHLTPRTASRCSTPDGNLQFYDDDCHDEYEWIRLPKKRDYDLFQAARLKPQDRNKAQVPLTVARPNESNVTMWAKMDTGGGANTINSSTVTAIFGDTARAHMRAMTALDISLLPGAKHLQITHSVDLKFTAGKSRKAFERVNFFVVPDVVEQSSRDGVPNVILGYEFLKANDMLMIDLDYCYDPDPELEVIADKAENENGNALSILPSGVQVRGLPSRPGVSRPVRRSGGIGRGLVR